MFGNNDLVPRFIVIEGIDGAGTSTQRTILGTALESAGRNLFNTWEPTDSPIGALIRQALRHEISLEDQTIARLFAADRHEHIFGTHGILNRTKDGNWCLCDRYFFSSLAYQGTLVGREKVWALNRDFPLPEFVIFIDAPTETASQRRNKRGEKPELFEKDTLLTSVRRAYTEIFEQLRVERPEVNFLHADGALGIEELHREICGFLKIEPIIGR